ncbi:MAG: TetR/AcrR family transcriptional regulator [Clostridia bacterium]|nr:TetR/AcrR family transcriptional regulator [Clostridia bacterium]
MYHIKEDKREQRSAELLVGAARSLLTSEEPLSLNIALLCRVAGVSRTTFYRLFDTPQDLLQYAAERALRKVVSGYLQIRNEAQKTGAPVPTPTRWYVENFYANTDIIRGLIRSGRSGILLGAHKMALREYAQELFPDLDPASDEFVYFVDMRSSLLLGAVNAWVETGCHTSAWEIEQYVSRQLKFLNGEDSE